MLRECIALFELPKRKRQKYSLGLFLTLFICGFSLQALFVGCDKKKEHSLSRHPAFFFWRQKLDITPKTQKKLHRLSVKRFYVRLYDITWDNYRQSISVTPAIRVSRKSQVKGLDIVPVVFITPQVFRALSAQKYNSLAKLILRSIPRILGSKLARRVKELQIDCDWYPSIKNNYFDFLRILRKAGRKRRAFTKLSVTLRLHQVRDRRTSGIPPADSAMLMCYNMGSPAKFSSKNSLIDLNLIKAYLAKAKPYPIHVDIALGLFSWAAHFNPDHRFVRLIRNVRERDLLAKPKTFVRQKGALFEVKSTTELNGFRILAGDKLRVDEHKWDEVEKLTLFLRKSLRRFAPKGNIITALFHYQESVIKRFTKNQPKRLLKLVIER